MLRALCRELDPNTATFIVGVAVLCASVAQWSAPLAGVICGLVLIAVAVWPLVGKREGNDGTAR